MEALGIFLGFDFCPHSIIRSVTSLKFSVPPTGTEAMCDFFSMLTCIVLTFRVVYFVQVCVCVRLYLSIFFLLKYYFKCVSWCFLPSLYHLLKHLVLVLVVRCSVSSVEHLMISLYSALHKQSPSAHSIHVCNNWEDKLRNCPILLIDCFFVLGSQVSYQLTGYDVSSVD